MSGLVPLFVAGCASQELEPARLDRKDASTATSVGTCASVGSAILKNFQTMEELQRLKAAEEREPPATVALAFGRWFGPEGAGYTATEKLRLERAEVDRLEAVLAAKGCASTKN